MRSFLLFVLCAALYIGSYAQFPIGGGGRPGGGGIPNIGHFYGRIIDTKTNKGIEAASVQLIQSKLDAVTKKQKDTVISGMLTRGNGDFSLENLPIFGQFRLKITAIGYKAIDQKVAFDLKFGQGDMTQAMNAVDKDLGNIKLEQDAQTLDAVTVTGSKPLIEMGIDRKVINVEKNINAAGGTAVDVMRQVPSINVDIDGNVTMRNNAPQLFVDGRPTTLTLDQIPADAIQSVELITNPSAKYDASGGQAGILNIVLKKNRKAGYNGSIRAGVDSRGKFNGGGDLNVRQGKVNVFANAMYNQRKSKGWGYSDQLNTVVPDSAVFTHSDNRSITNGAFGFGRLGLDYFIDNRNTITVSQSYVRGEFKNDNRNGYLVDTSDVFYESRYRNTYGKGVFQNFGTQLSFKHNFAKAGREWTADVNYNKSKNDNNSDTRSRSFSDMGQANPKNPEALQTSQNNGNNSFVVIQTDYVDPINDQMKWEGGLRAQIRNSKSDQYIYNNGILNPLASSNFKYTDYVYAAYATFSQKIQDKWSYQLGLRAESSNYDGEQTNKGQSYSNSFPISLFPSVFITRNFENKQDLQVNYSRRVNRPNFFQLMPNLDISDTLNYSTGNPNLKPEFTHSLELSYQKTYGQRNNSFLATIFGKYTTNLIARYQDYRQLPGLPKPVFVSTWENASDAYAAGLELVFRNNWTKWWDMNFSTNVYYSKINGSNVVKNLENERTSYSAKINNTFKWNKGWSIQLSGDYISKSALPVSTSSSGGGGGRGGFMGGGFGGGSPSTVQGYIQPNYGVDLGLRKEFPIKKNTATVSVNWSDIFRTRRYFAHSEAAGFIQDDWRRRDPQIVRVNFSYRFGKLDIGLFKRKNMKGEQEGMQNGMQGVGQ